MPARIILGVTALAMLYRAFMIHARCMPAMDNTAFLALAPYVAYINHTIPVRQRPTPATAFPAEPLPEWQCQLWPV